MLYALDWAMSHDESSEEWKKAFKLAGSFAVMCVVGIGRGSTEPRGDDCGSGMMIW